jgi:group I intron endonuclease
MMDYSEVGTYMLHNSETDEVYVGSSSDLERRKAAHLSDLRAGRHKNKALQAAYNRNGNFDFVSLGLDSRQEAYAFEQLLITELGDHEGLLNVQRKVVEIGEDQIAKMTASRKGSVITEEHRLKISQTLEGREFSELTRQRISEGVKRHGDPSPQAHAASKLASSKPVIVDGVRYECGTDAARVLGISSALLFYRINSESERFTGYSYAT